MQKRRRRMRVVTPVDNPPKVEGKKLINENGGEFMSPLDVTKVKVVLAPDNSLLSEKMKFARFDGFSGPIVQNLEKIKETIFRTYLST
ncbi:hypothetical protein PV326_002389 [Microctonus aethiopoides]|nr:hypothetical protein PV326_002389 [Microctonus aethiopoides]